MLTLMLQLVHYTEQYDYMVNYYTALSWYLCYVYYFQGSFSTF